MSHQWSRHSRPIWLADPRQSDNLRPDPGSLGDAIAWIAAFREQPKSGSSMSLIRKRTQVLDLAKALYRDAAEAATVWTLGLTKEQRGRLVTQERE